MTRPNPRHDRGAMTAVESLSGVHPFGGPRGAWTLPHGRGWEDSANFRSQALGACPTEKTRCSIWTTATEEPRYIGVRTPKCRSVRQAPSPLFSPGGEAKWVRNPSVRAAITRLCLSYTRRFTAGRAAQGWPARFDGLPSPSWACPGCSTCVAVPPLVAFVA